MAGERVSRNGWLTDYTDLHRYLSIAGVRGPGNPCIIFLCPSVLSVSYKYHRRGSWLTKPLYHFSVPICAFCEQQIPSPGFVSHRTIGSLITQISTDIFQSPRFVSPRQTLYHFSVPICDFCEQQILSPGFVSHGTVGSRITQIYTDIFQSPRFVSRQTLYPFSVLICDFCELQIPSPGFVAHEILSLHPTQVICELPIQ
jgi:hypothetical protein